MKRRNTIIGTLLAGSIAVFTLSGIAIASPDRAPGQGFGGCHHGQNMRGGMMGGMQGGMSGGMMKHGGGGLHRMLSRLDLSDAQRDQVFNIVYKRMPEMRAKKIALRKGRQALREAMQSKEYDAQHIRSLAEAQGKTLSEMMVLRASLFHQVSGILTPEQRTQLQQMQARRMAHHRGPNGGPQGGPGM